MSAWSIGVMIDRLLAFSAARNQSREFAPLVAGCLQEGKIGEALEVAEQNGKSHLAKVVGAGLKEYNSGGGGGGSYGGSSDGGAGGSGIGIIRYLT